MKHTFGSMLIALFFLLMTMPVRADHNSSYVILRSYYPTNDPLSYQNMYMYTGVHYIPTQNVTFHLSLMKGRGEAGYYPVGYFTDAVKGFYEKGTYYLFLQDQFRFNKIIVGNYIPLFGQGLLFGGIYPLIMVNPYYDLARYRDGIYPSGSSSKNVLLEGIALEYEFNTTCVRPFFSWNTYDGSAGESSYYKYCDNDLDEIPNEIDDDDFTGIQDEFGENYSCKSNLFSCIRDGSDYGEESDRAKRNNLAEYVAGVNVSMNKGDLRIGSTVAYTHFNRLVDPYYNFDSNEGDKTGHYFRGKAFFCSSVYFKLYKPVELFGEVVGTFHNELSYYPEFNGGLSTVVGFSGGARRKFRNTGLILWGAYLPANLVNPHALELPDGCNNLACGLLGLHRVKNRRQFTNWLYLYSELYNKDYPDHEEAGICYSYFLKWPAGKKVTLKIDQSFEGIDNYYYAPLVWSYKVSSKASVKYALSDEFGLTFRFENRTGGSSGEDIESGTGITAEIFSSKKTSKISFSIMGYTTDESRFAYLYPYERSLYRWSFVPQAVHGRGFISLFTLVYDWDKLTMGTKVKYNLEMSSGVHQEATIYGISEYRF